MKEEDKLGTLEEAINFDKKRNYQYTAPQTKPLSDDERKQLFYKHTTSPTGMMFETMNITEFFKATEEIEERHGIK